MRFTQLLQLCLRQLTSWAYNIDIGNINVVIFLDLKKAFNTVDHEIPLSKLCLRIHSNGFNCIWRTVYNNAQLVGPYLTAVY